jgi:ribonuclease HI
VSEWTVWADGSGTTGGPAGIGYVARNGSRETSGSLALRNATNQQAELLAAAYALHCLPEGSTVKLISDSQYLVLGWNEFPNRKRKKNLDHWRRLELAAARHREVTFEWTRGHVGTWGNEEADRLAGEARSAALTLPPCETEEG